jgi:hypothetical protein
LLEDSLDESLGVALAGGELEDSELESVFVFLAELFDDPDAEPEADPEADPEA